MTKKTIEINDYFNKPVFRKKIGGDEVIHGPELEIKYKLPKGRLSRLQSVFRSPADGSLKVRLGNGASYSEERLTDKFVVDMGVVQDPNETLSLMPGRRLIVGYTGFTGQFPVSAVITHYPPSPLEKSFKRLSSGIKRLW